MRPALHQRLVQGAVQRVPHRVGARARRRVRERPPPAAVRLLLRLLLVLLVSRYPHPPVPRLVVRQPRHLRGYRGAVVPLLVTRGGLGERCQRLVEGLPLLVLGEHGVDARLAAPVRGGGERRGAHLARRVEDPEELAREALEGGRAGRGRDGGLLGLRFRSLLLMRCRRRRLRECGGGGAAAW